MKGAENKVTRLGGFQGGGEGFLVADLPDENHIRVFPQGGTQSVVELEGVHPHLPVPDQGSFAFMHEFHRVLNREDVAGFIAIDPVDHRGEGGAFAGTGGACHQDQTLGATGQFGQHLRQLELLHREDGLRDQAQHHRRAPQRVEQVDSDAHEGERMGAVELLLAEEGIDLLRGQDLVQPPLKSGEVGGGPFGGLHLTAGPVPRHFANAEMNVGVSFLVRDLDDGLQVGCAMGCGRWRSSGRCYSWLR